MISSDPQFVDKVVPDEAHRAHPKPQQAPTPGPATSPKDQDTIMNTADQLALAQRFAVALATLDGDALRQVCTVDVTWTIPGDSSIAGKNEGVEGILTIQRTLQKHELKADLQKILHGRDSLVAWLHDTGDKDGKHLDVNVALVLELRDGRISAITGHISDVPMFTNYLS
jgi:ketosteroid isomerase-like protein